MSKIQTEFEIPPEMKIPPEIENAGDNSKIVFYLDSKLHDLHMNEMALQDYKENLETCRAVILAYIENLLPVRVRHSFTTKTNL